MTPQKQQPIAVIDATPQVSQEDLLSVLADVKQILKQAIAALS
jgi:hypothetical protein